MHSITCPPPGPFLPTPLSSSLPCPALLRTLTLYRCILRHSQIGRTGSIMAAWNGHEAVVRLLLEHKADVNAADEVRSERPALSVLGCLT